MTTHGSNSGGVAPTVSHDYGALMSTAQHLSHTDNRRDSIDITEPNHNTSSAIDHSGGHRLKHIAVIAVCCILVFLLFWIMAILGPAKSGIDCDDQSSIRRPHRTTLTPTFLFTLITSLVAIFILIITEFIMYRKSDVSMPHRRKMRFSLCKRWQFPSWFYFAARNLVAYAFGVHVTQGSVFLIRMMVAIPRPDWWAICQPIFPNNGTCPEHQYTTDYECRNQNERQIWDASRSFPSGHVAFIVFNAVFLTIYMERRCREPRRRHDSMRYFLRTIEFWLFVAAFFTSAERVQANSHHPSDVYAAWMFGIVGAISASQLLLLVSDMWKEGSGGGGGRPGSQVPEQLQQLHQRQVDVEAAAANTGARAVGTVAHSY